MAESDTWTLLFLTLSPVWFTTHSLSCLSKQEVRKKFLQSSFEAARRLYSTCLFFWGCPSATDRHTRGSSASQARPQREAMKSNIRGSSRGSSKCLLSSQTICQPLCYILYNNQVWSSQIPQEKTGVVPILQMRKTEAREFTWLAKIAKLVIDRAGIQT